MRIQPASSLASHAIPTAFTSQRVYNFDKAAALLQQLGKRFYSGAVSAGGRISSGAAARSNERRSEKCGNSGRSGIV